MNRKTSKYRMVRKKMINYIPSNLIYLRKQMKMSQDEFYLHMKNNGIPFCRSVYSHLELGRIFLNIDKAIQISKILNVGFEDFCTKDLSK